MSPWCFPAYLKKNLGEPSNQLLLLSTMYTREAALDHVIEGLRDEEFVKACKISSGLSGFNLQDRLSIKKKLPVLHAELEKDKAKISYIQDQIKKVEKCIQQLTPD